MNKLRKRISSLKLKNRLLLSFITMITLPSVIIGMASYLVIERMQLDEIGSSVQEVLQSTMLTIDSKFKSIEHAYDTIMINSDLKMIFEDKDPSEEMKRFYLKMFYEDVYPQVFQGMTDRIHSVYFYGTNGVHLVSDNNKVARLRSPEYVQQTSIYQFAEKAKGRPVWIFNGGDQFGEGNSDKPIILNTRKVLSNGDFKDWGLLVINVRENYLYESFEKTLTKLGGQTLLISGAGQIISAADKQVIGSYIDEDLLERVKSSTEGSFIYPNEDSFVHYYTSKISDNKIFYILPRSNVYDKVSVIKKTILTVILISFMIAAIIALLITSSIVRPIKVLLHNMKRVREGNFHTRVTLTSNDEISQLGLSFNDMTQQISLLMSDIERTQEKLRNSELRALQAQINPHFLYNALGSIYWMTKTGEYDEIGKMSMQLASFFRLSLNKGNEMTTLYNELKHLEMYMSILKIQHESKLDYAIRAEPDIVHFECIKLIIQPLAENAIMHGIKHIKEKGFIKVSAVRAGDKILISVTDNGAGADLNFLESQLIGSKKTGYGLYNIQERLQLHYGKEYGVSFAVPKTGIGLQVTISIPIIKAKEEWGHDVQDDIG